MEAVGEGVGIGGSLDPRALLDHLPDPTVLVSSDGCVRWMNEAAERQLGETRDVWIGRSGFDLIHPDDLPSAAFSLVTVQEKRVGTPLEIRLRTTSGWRLAEVVGAPIDDGSIVLTMRDLTERRRWEVAGDEVAKLRTLVHNAPTLFMLLDHDGCVVASSGAITRALGHDQAGLEGRSLVEVLAPVDRPRFTAVLRRASQLPATSTTPTRIEVRLRDAHRDRWVPYELAVLNRLADPTVGGLIVTGHDVSDRVAAEDELHELVSVLNATLDSIADGVLVVDLDGRVMSFNRRFADMWRLTDESLTAGTEEVTIRNVADQFDDPASFLERIKELYADPEAESFDVLSLADGRVFERSSMPQRIDGRVVGRVWSFRDITRQKQLEAELAHQAFHDSLTGLSNQALFRDRVTHAAVRASRDDTELAVLYFDIDDFKRVNDSLGHPAGDRLLVEVAERLRHCVREVDTTARLGGDEFAVLVEDLTNRAQALEVADRLVQTLRRPLRIGQREIVTSVSVGVAFSGPGIDAEQLLRNADLAMYAAKRRGKSTYEVYEPTMHAQAVARLEIEGALRAAGRRDELRLVYQPVVDLESGHMTGVEALLRWDHPELGELGPASFVAAAEELGLMDDIGGFVVEAVCDQARQWAEIDPTGTFTVSLNVSAIQVADGSVVTQLRDALERGDIDPRRIVVELTETAMLRDTTAAAATMSALRALGVRLALDDFGTGFSSLTHLQRLPIDILKIDRSFLTSSDHDAALVKGLISMAQDLGLTAVAEGIETAGHARFLRSVGCRYGQGYLYAAPGEPDMITAMLLEQQVLEAPPGVLR